MSVTFNAFTPVECKMNAFDVPLEFKLNKHR